MEGFRMKMGWIIVLLILSPDIIVQCTTCKTIHGSPGPRQQWGSRVESLYSLCSVSELLRATPGSTGLKLSSTTATTPDIPVTPIPMGVAGPLLEGIVGLVLGRSSLSLRGISVVPGVVDSDYTGIKLKF